MTTRALEVVPKLVPNLFLDHTLRLLRGPDGVELQPRDCMGSGDGYIHFSIVTTIGEEAAWQALGSDHAVPCTVSVELLRPAEVSKGPIVAVGRILRAGKACMSCEAEVTQDMKLIAKVHVTFVPFVKRYPSFLNSTT